MQCTGVHDQVIHSHVTCLVSSKSFYVSFVYGLHYIIARRPLWDSLYTFGMDGLQPWIVLEDFNSILEGEEWISCAQPTAYEAKDFLNCCVDLGLTDIQYTGARYTWNNGRIWSKIDRAMCNQRWLVEGAYAMANFLPPGCVSDHSPCVVSLFDVQRSPKTCFMFFNMWANHEEFLDLVKQVWENEVDGTKQFGLRRKLKLLKSCLRGLNRQKFSHIVERARVARKELKKQQILLHDNPTDSPLLKSVKKLQFQAANLIEAERKFCIQKTKVDFLLNGDKGTKLFHSLIKRNLKRNFIASLTKKDGTPTASKNEVHQEFLQFYMSLLGTHEETDCLEECVIEDGPRVTPQQADMLTACFSKEDIKEALFDIGNEK